MFSIFFSLATQIYQKIKFGPIPNLMGDRDIEYSFIAANFPNKPGKVLDFGSGGTPLSLIAKLKGANVTAIDLIKYNYMYQIDMKFVQDDLLKTNVLKNNYFDVVINCSSIEHVGLIGRYGIKQDIPNGDIAAMLKLQKLLKRNGIMLLTLPVGKDMIIKGMHRIYGKIRLPKLLNEFTILKQIFWIKDNNNIWQIANKDRALQTKGSGRFYAIGCFVLKNK